MGKRQYSVIVKDTSREYDIGKISGIISTFINNKEESITERVKVFKDNILEVGKSKILIFDVYTSESKWKKIRNFIQSTYPKMCTFIRTYDTWLEEGV